MESAGNWSIREETECTFMQRPILFDWGILGNLYFNYLVFSIICGGNIEIELCASLAGVFSRDSLIRAPSPSAK